MKAYKNPGVVLWARAVAKAIANTIIVAAHISPGPAGAFEDLRLRAFCCHSQTQPIDDIGLSGLRACSCFVE